ncbi:MAG: substrate-binding periplasmic protein [Gammaproteobacteria bacterium]
MSYFARSAALLLFALGLNGCDSGTPGGNDQAAAPDEQVAEIVVEATDDCHLTMGWDPWEPYHYMNPVGEINGLDVEIVSAIAADAKCEVSFERDSWANLLRRIRDGSVDLISGATLTPERESYAYFSKPFRNETFALFVRAGERDQFSGTTLKELLDSGMRVGITEAYIYGDMVRALQDDPSYADRLFPADLGESSAGRMLDGEIDGFIEDIFVASSMIRRRGLEDDIETHPVDIGGSNEVRLMFSRSSVDGNLVSRFDESLVHLRESGEYENIRNRYLR